MARSSAGMTLVEVMISMAVFLILIGAVIVLRPSSSSSEAAHQSAQLLVSDLRAMQSKAQAGALLEGALPLGGYGVRLDRSTLEAANHYSTLAEDGDHQFQPLNDPVLPGGTKSFFGNTGFFGLTINDVVSTDDTLLVAFSPTTADVVASTETGQPIFSPDICVSLRTVTGAMAGVHLNGQSGQAEVLSSCP